MIVSGKGVYGKSDRGVIGKSYTYCPATYCAADVTADIAVTAGGT